MSMDKDFTPTGVRIEGAYENDRNAASADLFKAIVRKVFGVQDVIVGHHIVYVTVDHQDGFDIQVVQEIPSADALIFDPQVYQKLWPRDWPAHVTALAVAPVSARDKLLARLCEGLL